jgi:hypothetical protein
VKTLRQSKLRIDRAREKLSDLKLAIQLAWKDAVDTVAEQTDPNTRDVFFHFRDNLGDDAALTISEFVLHARAALDYIVFALAWRDTGAEQKGTQFPINKSPEDFAGNRTGCLKHLTDEHVAMIERFQPYQGFRLHPLLRLVYWSNQDKHREPIRVNMMGRSGPLFVSEAGTAGAVALPPHVEVNVCHSFEVLLSDGTDVEDAEKALTEILAQVEKIVSHFDSVLR